MERTCRFCGAPLRHTFVNLGMSPLSNAYVRSQNLKKGETFYPLHVYVCQECHLVQLEEFESPEEIFGDYAYFSSYSESWLAHCKAYVEMAVKRFQIGENSKVVEIASNDGYLLQYFLEKGIPVLGIEPAKNVAKIAREKGIDTISDFFGFATARSLVEQGNAADLLIGNNVLAHVPDINDFVGGMKVVLKKTGRITMEFPHLLNLIKQNQFDTIYHEHFSYLSLHTVISIFQKHGLCIFDVEKLPTHGGSLRIFACHNEMKEEISDRVGLILEEEKEEGLMTMPRYQSFGKRVQGIKRDILSFFIREKEAGKTFVGYGAPAKGNTLLNYCGIGEDFIDYVVDRNPHKQGLFLPGTRLPIRNPEWIEKTKPDYLLVLPWNLKDEIMEQNQVIREWGGKFLLLIPEVQVL